MQTAKQRLGQWGEDQAVVWLQTLGYEIVVRNYRCPVGEIDIVARLAGELSFIEVKTRQDHPGSAERAVGAVKRRHLAQAAKAYCQEYQVNLSTQAIRFEQVSIYWTKGQKTAHFSKYILP